MSYCCVRNCLKNNKTGNSLHRFPKDAVLRREWVLKVRGNSRWDPGKRRICDEHFIRTDWIRGKVLKPGAIPSVFPIPPTPASQINNIFLEHDYYRKPCVELETVSVTGWEVLRYTPQLDHSYCKVPHPAQSSVTGRGSPDTKYEEMVAPDTKYEEIVAEVSVETLGSASPCSSTAVSSSPAIPPSCSASKVVFKLEEDNSKLREKLSSLHNTIGTLRQAVTKKKATINRLKEEKITVKNEAAVLREVTNDIISKNKWVQGNFSPQQIKAAVNGNSKGCKWDTESIKKGLKVRFTGGSAGLETVNKDVVPLPSVRTLQRRIECIKFNPGLLYEILEPFKQQVLRFHPNDRDATICFDAMSLKATKDYDVGSGQWIGGVTLPGSDPAAQAHKMEVYMLAGVRQHWKLNAAYHFTPKEEIAAGTSEVIVDLLKTSEEMGLNIIALVCDMGNRGVLNSLGFKTTKAKRTFCIPNPVNPDKLLHVVPDVAHVYKSLKEMLLSNRTIQLDATIVKKFNLPSSTVDLAHVEWLVSFQEDMDLKFSPRLSKKDISKNHFNKMNVASARRVLNDKTGKALQYLSERGICPDTYKTTAWFICFVDKWFNICTSRDMVHALSLKNKAKYDEAIEHLNDVINVFLTMKVGKGEWKPVQTHIAVATEALLAIQHHLLYEKGYQFVLLSRFLQDRVESLFAVVRIQRPVPSPRDAKYRLRQVTLSQCTQKVRKSSYDHDGDYFLVALEDILKCAKEKEVPREDIPVVVLPPWQYPTAYDIIGPKDEGAVVYRVCGYMLHSLRINGRLKCDHCFAVFQHQGPEPLDIGKWVTMTDYKEGAQIQVSKELFNMCRAIDFNLQLWKKTITITPNVKESVLKAIDEPVKKYSISWCGSCPDPKERLIDRFVDLRLNQLSGSISRKLQEQKSATHLSSKSMGYRYLAGNLTTPTLSATSNLASNNISQQKQMSPPKKRLRRLALIS